ncbi:DUF819 domain-containing protein [Hazenella coriacea]|uniref:Putative membrane protein n=1 Tax=Hazenella coriacea TaxID=1179467 RepID=A0A4R3LBV6_9BACL|nr:DUF819 family protein [Hazenella coriacea]TCS96715.1 putative membrane protein [Hazenella coriacea]
MPDVWITSTFGVGAVITVLIAISFWLERRFQAFSFLGTALLVITGSAVLVNLGVIPSSLGEEIHPLYTFANDYGVPMAIVLLLLSTDLKNVLSLGKSAMIAFTLGAIGTAIGAMIAVNLTADGIGPEAWKVAGQFAASYIGGGINYAAVGNALQTSETMFATGAAADNIMTNLWMVMTAVIPALLWKYYPTIRKNEGSEPSESKESFWKRKNISIYDMVTLLSVTFVIIAISDFITPYIDSWIGFSIPTVIVYTSLALLVSWFTPIRRFHGGEEMGNILLHFFFATMGAGTIVSTLIDRGPIVFIFLLIVVTIHALIVFGIGRWFKIEIEMLAVASQACVGGPSTALALATSKGWVQLVTPAVLMGILGYAVGNYVGISLGYLMKTWIGG